MCSKYLAILCPWNNCPSVCLSVHRQTLTMSFIFLSVLCAGLIFGNTMCITRSRVFFYMAFRLNCLTTLTISLCTQPNPPPPMTPAAARCFNKPNLLFLKFPIGWAGRCVGWGREGIHRLSVCTSLTSRHLIHAFHIRFCTSVTLDKKHSNIPPNLTFSLQKIYTEIIAWV